MDEVHGGGASAEAFGSISVRGAAATVVVVAAAMLVLREMEVFAAPVLLGILLAYALEPLVRAFMRCRLPRTLAVFAAAAVVALVCAAGARAAKRKANAFLDALPDTVAAIKEAALRQDEESGDAARPGPIRRLQRAATDLQATIDAASAPVDRGVKRVSVEHGFDARAYLISAWDETLATGAQLIAVGVLTLVLLITGDRIKRKVVHAAGPRFEQRLLTSDVIRDIDSRIERYLAARLLISATVGGATAAAMWWLGVRQPLVLGLIAGALNVVPFIGPSLGVAICASVAFAQFHAVPAALEAGSLATIIAAIEGNLITPWLTGRAGELNVVAAFVSVLFWGWMWNVWGLLLAIPIMVSIKAAADRIEPLQPLGELLGRQPFAA